MSTDRMSTDRMNPAQPQIYSKQDQLIDRAKRLSSREPLLRKLLAETPLNIAAIQSEIDRIDEED